MTKPMENKSPEMKAFIESVFPGTMKAIAECNCPMCTQPVGKFRDILSRQEYKISGLCQACQDKVFGADDEYAP
jgi:hypothetical protein